MKNIIIFSLEPIDTRYTGEWHKHIPGLLDYSCADRYNIVQIDGDTNSGATTEGAFLDFISTNQWKNEQANKFFEMVKQGKVGRDDILLFPDGWNPIITEIKYVSDLMDMQWKIHALFHAGSWDENDFLGRIIGAKDWVRDFEKSLYWAIDYCYFATYYHANLFFNALFNRDIDSFDEKIIVTGWPMEYVHEMLEPYTNIVKENLIVFPHRIAPEKQVAIFRDLADSLPEYEFVVCQDTKLTKAEYHTLLAKAKIVFSASLQETLGIGCYEGAVLGAFPLVPDRLSYQEMYSDEVKYPSEWTESWELYLVYKEDLINRIRFEMASFYNSTDIINQQVHRLENVFFNSDVLITNIITSDE